MMFTTHVKKNINQPIKTLQLINLIQFNSETTINQLHKQFNAQVHFQFTFNNTQLLWIEFFYFHSKNNKVAENHTYNSRKLLKFEDFKVYYLEIS